jgi:hypothetical protein
MLIAIDKNTCTIHGLADGKPHLTLGMVSLGTNHLAQAAADVESTESWFRYGILELATKPDSIVVHEIIHDHAKQHSSTTLPFVTRQDY